MKNNKEKIQSKIESIVPLLQDLTREEIGDILIGLKEIANLNCKFDKSQVKVEDVLKHL